MKKWLYSFLLLVATLNGQIKIKPVDSYGLKKLGRNTYVLKLNDSRQTLVRLTGVVEDKGYHRVVWKTDKKYWWSKRCCWSRRCFIITITITLFRYHLK